MLLRKIFFTINLNIVKKIISYLYKDILDKSISRKNLNLIIEKFKFKIFNLNWIFYYGIMGLSLILMLLNLFKKDLILLDKILFFNTLKNFYFKLITFIIYSEFKK